MNHEYYFHLFANGNDAKNFITSETEFKAAFNRFGICAHSTGATVLSFSIEDSHPHALLRGTPEICTEFKLLFESMSMKSIVQQRGSADGVCLHCELDMITDMQYLKNVAAYTIIQATKDGKAVMPYDYRYGTGSLYFRNKYSVLPWLIDDFGRVSKPVRFDSLTVREKALICHSRTMAPDDWLVCNGFILPTNYVDVSSFESIFATHNCYRVFLASKKSSDQMILERMSMVRGVNIEDLEARTLCAEVCMTLFNKKTARHLNTAERLHLARTLRHRYLLSYRQLALLVRIPESELRMFVK